MDTFGVRKLYECSYVVLYPEISPNSDPFTIREMAVYCYATWESTSEETKMLTTPMKLLFSSIYDPPLENLKGQACQEVGTFTTIIQQVLVHLK